MHNVLNLPSIAVSLKFAAFRSSPGVGAARSSTSEISTVDVTNRIGGRGRNVGGGG